MHSDAQTIASKLLQINAIKLSPQKPFTWASGILSPIYCDNRLTLSYPEIRNLIIDAFVSAASQYNQIDVIAGVATAGIPHGALIAQKMNLPFAYVRSSSKGHGRQNQIEGIINKEDKVLVIEDLISTGGSSLKAVDCIREIGAQVITVMSIFNYGFLSAVEAFESKKCTFASLSNYDILLKEAVKQEYIKESELELLKQWKSNPQTWGK